VDTPNDTQIKVPYNRDLKALEDVLAAVRRPGDFFVRGALETPMPRVEIDGVGVISFPILDSQIRTSSSTQSALPTVAAVKRSWTLLFETRGS